MATSGGYTRLVAGEERKVEIEDGIHAGDRASNVSSSRRRSSTTRRTVERVKYLCRWLPFQPA
jgi:hypothetical protein